MNHLKEIVQESSNKLIRVVIANEHSLIRVGLRLILSQEDSFHIVGEMELDPEIIQTIGELNPDVILLGIDTIKTETIELITNIKKENPKTNILFITTDTDENLIYKALKAGAGGYVLKDASTSELIKAIYTVQEGELWIERKMIVKMIRGKSVNSSGESHHTSVEQKLTPREMEVLRLLVTGLTNREIAQKLFISEKTVKSHLHNIFRKLQVARRLQAVLYAVKRGLT